MLSIGEFARLVGVSVRMLRHYDRLGLLEPARVDEYTGYRSYSTGQLDRRLASPERLAALFPLCCRYIAAMLKYRSASLVLTRPAMMTRISVTA